MAENRREHLKLLGVGAAATLAATPLPVLGQQEHSGHGTAPMYHVPEIPPFSPKFFSAEEGLMIVRLADLIIPPTDSPGAAAAGVPHFIDAAVLASPEKQKVFRTGIAWLDGQAKEKNGKGFLELSEAEQIALLTPVSVAAQAKKPEGDGAVFFAAMKGLTTEGYYTSYAGLVQELGYKGNQMLATFPGCTHDL